MALRTPIVCCACSGPDETGRVGRQQKYLVGGLAVTPVRVTHRIVSQPSTRRHEARTRVRAPYDALRHMRERTGWQKTDEMPAFSSAGRSGQVELCQSSSTLLSIEGMCGRSRWQPRGLSGLPREHGIRAAQFIYASEKILSTREMPGARSIIGARGSPPVLHWPHPGSTHRRTRASTLSYLASCNERAA